MEVIGLLRPKVLLKGLIFIIGWGFSRLSELEKDCPACIFKRRSSFQYVLSLLSLFLSGRITLKVVFYYFHHYLFKVYKCINQHFEKPNQVLFQKYRCTPLVLHLSQWQIANETESLIQLHFAQIKRNPE
jgi:hypothetical protein